LLSLTLALMLVTVLLGTVLAMGMTESGSRRLVHWGLAMLPGSATAGEVEGRLLGRLGIRDFQWTFPGGSVNAGRFELDWQAGRLLNGHLQVERIWARTLTVRLPASPEEGTQTPEEVPIVQEGGDMFHLPEMLDAIQIPLSVHLVHFGVEDVFLEQGSISVSVRGAFVDDLRADPASETVSLGQLRLDMSPFLSLEAGGQTILSAGYEHELSLDWVLETDEAGQVKGRSRLSGDRQATVLEQQLSGFSELDARVVFNWGDIPDIDGRLVWKDLRWPLWGEADYQSGSGEIQLRGTLDDFSASAQTVITGKDLPDMRLELAGHGGKDKATIDHLDLFTLDGQVSVRGDIQWQPDLQWDLEGDISTLDIGKYREDVPLTLGAKISVSGSLVDAVPDISVDLSHAHGELGGRPMDARGKIRVQGRSVYVDGLSLKAARNRAQVQGHIKPDDWSMTVDIDGQHLEDFWDGLNGSLRIQGSLQGSPARPRVSLTGVGNAMAFQDYRLQDLGLDVQLSPDTHSPSRIRLNASELALAGRKVDLVKVQMDGTLEQHRINLGVFLPEGGVNGDLQGGYLDRRWSGQWLGGDIFYEGADRWALQAPFELLLGARVVRFGQHCWQSRLTKFCMGLDLDQTAGTIASEGRISQLPMDMIGAFFPGIHRLEGRLSADWTVEGLLDNPEVTARLDALETRYVLVEDDIPLAVRLKDAGIQLTFEDHKADVDLGLDFRLEKGREIAPWGELKGNMRFDLESPPVGIDGRVALSVPSLERLDRLIPALGTTAGALMADVSVGGNLERPLIAGNISLDDGQVALPDLGTVLRDINLSVQSRSPEWIEINGSMLSGKGRLDLEGGLIPDPVRNWPFELRIAGEDFQLMQTEEADVAVSPRLLLSRDANKSLLAGEVDIDHARIKLRELQESSVALSDDEVIVGEDRPLDQSDTETRSTLAMNVIIDLGDRVTFEGIGLKTGIVGDLNIFAENAGDAVRAVGQLGLVEATYKAYGQDLVVERGAIIFTGLIDDPALDVKAYREVSNSIKAGLLVTGPVSAPNLTVYSEPAMEESEALSYLVTGKGLDEDFNFGSAGLAWAMGMSQTDRINTIVSGLTGLDEVSFDGDDFENSALSLGKYITPELYVGYIYGLFEQTAAWEIRYDLTRNISVKGKAGDRQEVDLIYNVEFGDWTPPDRGGEAAPSP
jgi:translocation and assembly module TamB